MDVSKIKDLIEKHYPGAVEAEDEHSTPAGLIIKAEAIHDVCDLIHADKLTYFDMLSCLSGVDNGPEANTMEVIYHLYSIPKDISLTLKVILDREKPVIQSVTDIWRTANWHERETYDMYGIQFEGHPDLRRILLPKDWVGHPLRKDYQEQETYHGMNVVYDRDEEVQWKEERGKMKEESGKRKLDMK